MARDQAYREAEKKIEEARRSGVTELDLRDMQLTELPESIGTLTQLHSLNLFPNQLTELPLGIWKLTNLNELGLRDNKLTKLPLEIGCLTNLVILDLRNNNLTELPPEIWQLTNLNELGLRDNKLTKLPPEIGYLTNLVTLDLRNNNLTELPPEIGRLTKLITLILYDNRLTSLPVEIGRLTNVTELDFGRGFLESINLGGNKLTNLPPEIGHLTNLRRLGVSENLLTEVPPEIRQLNKLTELDLSNNKLTALPPEIGQLNNLTKLRLGNDISLNELLTLIEEINASTEDMEKTYLLEASSVRNKFTKLPPEIWKLNGLTELDLSNNQFTELPPEIRHLINLTKLSIDGNQLAELPPEIWRLNSLTVLNLSGNKFTELPPEIGQLTNLTKLNIKGNQLAELPFEIGQLDNLTELYLETDFLNPELASAYEQGVEAVKAYLRAKAAAHIPLNEAKLILVGEGEVGKSCLLGVLCGDIWKEDRPTTHGIEIKPVKVTDPDSKNEITLNGWDFGGQRVYRPTHQLFFSAPAVYLVVWKPREGPQQGFVKEWIQLVKRREPSAKIIVVATHGGPQQRKPDIDRQELWDLFGKDTIIDFFHVESKPDENGNRRGIEELKRAIARVASSLPEMGRSVPKSFQETREALQKIEETFLPFERLLAICREHKIDDQLARLFVTISHKLGHLIHYQHDPALRDVVVLKPDWLAIAISFVLDDEETRKVNHGVVSFSRLSQLWNDPKREPEFRYTPNLHPLFLRLMERFDLSYKVVLPTEAPDAIGFWQQVKGVLNRARMGTDGLTDLNYTSLIANSSPITAPKKTWTESGRLLWPLVIRSRYKSAALWMAKVNPPRPRVCFTS